jgi:acyl-ACP thioesterase
MPIYADFNKTGHYRQCNHLLNIVSNIKEESMKNYMEQSFNLRYFEMNKHGTASPVTILTLLEETAAEHCHQIGHCLYSLEKKNIGWVLTSGVLDMVRYPRYRENITIRTWLSKLSLVKGHRENVIYDEEEKIIGKAKGSWVFYDIEKRKPIPIFNEIKMNWGLEQEISAEENFDLINHADESFLKTEYNVYRSDVDSYNHVNNIRYFNFLLESLPEEVEENYFLKIINAKFFAEAKLGEKIQVYINDNLGGDNFLHTMKSDTGNKTLAKAHSPWEKMYA